MFKSAIMQYIIYNYGYLWLYIFKDKLLKPGSQKDRKNSAPQKGKTSLLEVKNA